MAGIEELKSKLVSKNGMAMSNQYSVELPTEVGSSDSYVTKLSGMSNKTANILCKSVSMPGKQILTIDRQMGIFNEKVVNGFAVEDVSMTFYALNDYGAKKYFDQWRSAMLGEYTTVKPPPEEDGEAGPKPPPPTPLPKGTVGYKDDYVAPIKIHQLRKPIARFGFDVGPFSIDFDLLGASIYSVELVDAFPTTITSIELTNEADGLVEINVTFSYTNWRVIKDERGLGELKLSLGSIF